ncbi:MAG: hypothetical protein K0V04_33940 [Deltaproteobacteria bacterium]|nr:hypothetical protein [Deltaproteobacteria bacterium]
MSSRRARVLGVGLVLGLVLHAWALPALVDHGVAGALLAGGGHIGTIAAAAAVLLLRLVGAVAVALIPVVLVGALMSHLTRPGTLRPPRARGPTPDPGP